MGQGVDLTLHPEVHLYLNYQVGFFGTNLILFSYFGWSLHISVNKLFPFAGHLLLCKLSL